MPKGARPVLSDRETVLPPGKGSAIQCRMDIRDWNSRDCEFEPSPTWGRDVMMPPALVDPKKGLKKRKATKMRFKKEANIFLLVRAFVCEFCSSLRFFCSRVGETKNNAKSFYFHKDTRSMA